jgi:hypothetical protein
MVRDCTGPVADACVPGVHERLAGMRPVAGDQQRELHDGEAPLPARFLGERDHLTADALSTMGGVCDQHTELARASIALLNAHRARDQAIQPGPCHLAGRDQLRHLTGGRARGALDPQAVFGDGVDAVHQVGDLLPRSSSGAASNSISIEGFIDDNAGHWSWA